MGSYASSQKTKEVLIHAAGELAAELGFSNVTTRAIAMRANENVASIHYHFGGKEQLFEAVIREITQEWKKPTMDELVKPFEDRLDDPIVQARVIRTMVHRNVDIMLRRRKPAWYSPVIFQLVREKSRLSILIREELLVPERKAMMRIIQRIQPKFTEQEKFLLYIMIKSPLIFHTDFKDKMLEELEEKNYSDKYLQRVEDVIVLQTQLLLGLPPDTEFEVGTL